MPKLLTEPFIQECVRKYLLEKKGFGKPEDKSTELTEHGVDIKVQKIKPKRIGWYFLVECKGDPSERVVSPGGWRSSAMNSALGQIITRMHTNRKALYGGYNYGVAFPHSFRNKVLQKIPYSVCNRLRLSIFIVDDNGKVEEYNHRKLKVIQNKFSK
ncbi:MAG: hypothetical protein NTW11_01465 [Candidatus Staskawiczbacteria bacterium]|nr:hypothetical protein [Candidatus Staskawiczbacteria bacterium]